jgi:uncharacterized repeat protein (TIGR04042 family)
MPAMHYQLKWPDATVSTCYSPSLVIKDYFEPGATYALADFMSRIRKATHIASERVRAKFGFACSRANDQLAAIELEALKYAELTHPRVEVLGFDENL